MPNESLLAAGTVRATLLEGALRPRVVGLAEAITGPTWLAALVEHGEARFAEDDTAVRGPALIWRPWPRGARVTFSAGTVGAYVLLGSTALAAAVGHMPESRDLRDMADHALSTDLDRGGETFAAVRSAFAGISAELQSRRPAAHAVVEAYLRVILIETYRAGSGQHLGAEPAPPSQRVFARFGALVERNFRDRWTVTRYAQALGISRDRLGDICARARGVGPKELIDRRVALEARLQLESSGQSIQQIASILGFSSPAQFNRFFARTVGQPPGAYRAAAERETAAGRERPARPYEWP